MPAPEMRIKLMTRSVVRHNQRGERPMANVSLLEDYLRERRKEIGGKEATEIMDSGFNTRFDYRYSVLPFVFADLISTRQLAEEDLLGLGEGKLAHIRALASH